MPAQGNAPGWHTAALSAPKDDDLFEIRDIHRVDVFVSAPFEHS